MVGSCLFYDRFIHGSLHGMSGQCYSKAGFRVRCMAGS